VRLLSLEEILAQPQREGWAVPAFDAINHETVLAALDSSAMERAPVIVMILPIHTPQEHWPGLIALVKAEAQRVGVPVCLQLDHAATLEEVHAALDVGFSSVMIDGSKLPLEDNIAFTRKAVVAAHARGVGVEAELGHVGGGDEVPEHVEATTSLTRVEEAAEFVRRTGVDALAVSIGTVHGLYQGEPDLDFDRLEALRQVVDVPLVMHGGSGTPDADIQRAVAGGICKINIWTELALAFSASLLASLDSPQGGRHLHATLAAARLRTQVAAQEKHRLLGSSGRLG
jgi:ketose-bisphosphate aldolase